MAELAESKLYEVMLGSIRGIVTMLKTVRAAGALNGTFDTRGLKPGIYTLQVTQRDAWGAVAIVRREFVLAPDPFDGSRTVR